jgi:hypothetical protein
MIPILMAAVFATVGVHLGLFEAVTGVIGRMARCEKCCSFWFCLMVAWYTGENIVSAFFYAIVAAYLSHWIGLLLILLNKIYERLWQRVNRRK